MIRRIELKETVKMKAVTEPFLRFAAAVIYTWDIICPDITPIITSANDSVHGAKSLHPHDLAWDLRTNNVGDAGKIEELARTLRCILGGDFDIIVEEDHIHGEYDP